MCVCLFVPKDLAYCWTDMILLCSESSYRFITILGTKGNHPKKKYPSFIIKLLLLY